MFELPLSWQADHENPTCSQFDCQAFEDCITASCIVCTEEYRPMLQCVVKRDCSITCEYNICADSKPEEAHWCSQEAPQVPTQPLLSPRMGDSSVPSNINRLLNMILFDASFDTVWLLNFCMICKMERKVVEGKTLTGWLIEKRNGYAIFDDMRNSIEQDISIQDVSLHHTRA
jgi:hypothetical protein